MQTGGPEKSDIAKLHIAAAYNHYIVIFWLHERGVDLDTRDEDGSAALHVAARNNCVGSCVVLLRLGCKESPRDKSGATPLHVAAASNPKNVGTIQRLSSLTDDVAAVDNNGQTPLHYAAKWGHVKACEYLVSAVLRNHCAALNAADNNGKTALHYAAEVGSVGVCEHLLMNGNNPVKTVDKDKSTPLHIAAMKGHLDVCMLLLRGEADRSAVNRNGSTPSDMAFDAGFRDLASMLSLDADIESVFDSSGSGPPCSASDENPEGSFPLIPTPTLEEGALTTSNPSVTGNCVEISWEPLEDQPETGIPHRPRRNSHLHGDLTPFTKPGDDREAAVSPVPRKRPSGRNESPDDPTGRMNPKRSPNYR